MIRDVVERSVWTFIQAFCAAFVVTDISTLSQAALAGAAAALAVVKGYAASRVNPATGASTL